MGSDKIVLITSNLPPVLGGSGVVYENLSRYSDGRIIVIAPKRSYTDGLPLVGWREHDRLAPYRVIRLDLVRSMLLPKQPGWVLKAIQLFADVAIRARLAWCLTKLIFTDSPAAVCIGELVVNRWLIILLNRIGIRVLVYVHGEEITTEDPYDPGHRRAGRALMAASQIIVVSRFTRDAVQKLIGQPQRLDKLFLIENGVDNARFRPMPKRSDLVEAYNLEKCFVFLSICRLLEKKGIDRAIEAFTKGFNADDFCRYLVVGSGPYQGVLQALAGELGVAGKVIFTGEVTEEDLPAYYSLGDVFVMPNRTLADGDTEGFGLVFLEANACGLPVIAGRDGGSIDAVKDGYSGVVVDGHSTAEIACAMLRLRRDEALRDRLRRGGRELAAGDDWREKAKEFLLVATAGKPSDDLGRC